MEKETLYEIKNPNGTTLIGTAKNIIVYILDNELSKLHGIDNTLKKQ